MSTKKVKSKQSKKTTVRKSTSSNLFGRIHNVNTFLEKRKSGVIGFLFFLSLGLSIVYYLQARNSPIMGFYKWDNSDMSFFDTWAKHIIAGDWWGDEVLHPFHDWHGDLATEYFRQFPDIATAYNYNPSDSLAAITAKKALINDIYKGKTFHQEPLYAYMLAILYKLFGPDPQWMYFLQFILAALTSVLVFLTGRHFFGALAGFLAALFVTLCGSIMVFEMVLLRTTLTNFLTVLLLYLFVRAIANQDLKNHLLFGVASGIALLAQTYFLLFILPAWLWLMWLQRKNARALAIHSAAFIGALLLIMAPLFIRNARVDIPAFSLASHGAMAYIPMNIKNSFPMESFYVHMPSLARMRHDAEGKMLPTVIECLKTFDDFGEFWRVYKDKIGGLFMWYEIPNNMNYYLYREIAPVLKAMPVHYYFIAPLGLAGLIIGLWRHRGKMMPLVLMTIASIIPMIIAGNLARYRTPLVITMCIFAAYFIVEVYTLFRERKTKLAFAALGLAVLAFIFTSTREDKNQFVFFGWDMDIFYRHYYMEELMKYEEAGNYQEFLKTTTRMVNDIPEYFLKVRADQPIKKGNEAESSRHVANFLETHLNILKYLKSIQEAAFYAERVNTLRARIADFNQRAGRQ